MSPKKQKILLWVLISPIIAYFGIGLHCLVYFFITTFSPTPQSKRNEMIEYYRNSEYLTVYGTIESYYSYSAEVGASMTLKLDEECINSLSEEQLDSFKKAGISVTSAQYSFTPKSKKVLQDNGFFDLIKTDGNGRLYSEETVTLIVNHKVWDHEDNPVAVGLSVGDTVYLDFETGKELLIEQIQNYMK